jgi:osmoprotectant transport system ATP-binding protein
MNAAAGAPAAVSFSHVGKTYGGVHAIEDVSFDVPHAACVVLLGPSGCGKTTLLKLVNRLLEPTSGRLLVEGRDVRSVDPVGLRRSIGYVIQQVGLFPHMSVARNVAVVPSLVGWSAAKTSGRVDELLRLVHLEPRIYRTRYPSQLSGGQQQRVGLARALAADPAILLMDEPFGAVDPIERTHLQDELQSLQARLRKTILFVTHDVDEALRLGDLIAVMRDGRLQQYDTPLAILARPANAFVAELTGAQDVLRRLSLIPVAQSMLPLQPGEAAPPGARIGAHLDLRQALNALLRSSADTLGVQDAGGQTIGTLGWRAIQQAVGVQRGND